MDNISSTLQEGEQKDNNRDEDHCPPSASATVIRPSSISVEEMAEVRLASYRLKKLFTVEYIVL